MAAAALELQKSVFARLTGDAALLDALGGPKIFDHAPPSVAFPYISFGRTSVYDWSTGTEPGTEQLFTLHVWSKAKGKSETLTVMDLTQTSLHDQPLEMDGHRLVNLRLEFSEDRFDEDLSVHHGLLRFRAVTEPSG